MEAGGKVGRYELGDQIGEGAMASVFESTHPVLERSVAIKILKREACGDANYVARFLDDARAAHGLDHPNVVRVLDVDDAGGRPYIVMERVHGSALDKWLTGRRVEVAAAARIGRDVARALAAAHRSGLVHRDVKPSNILIEHESGTAKLTDFGAAKRERPDDQQLTVVGQRIGTPRYMAPEQVEGKSVDERADVFALGATLYELLAGRPAFEGDTVAAVYHAILFGEPRPLGDVRPDAPPALVELVGRMLSKEPAARPGSGDEVAAVLDDVAEGVVREPVVERAESAGGDQREAGKSRVATTRQDGSVGGRGARATPPPPSGDEMDRPRWFVPVTAGIAVLAVVAVGGWWLFGSGDEQTAETEPDVEMASPAETTPADDDTAAAPTMAEAEPTDEVDTEGDVEPPADQAAAPDSSTDEPEIAAVVEEPQPDAADEAAPTDAEPPSAAAPDAPEEPVAEEPVAEEPVAEVAEEPAVEVGEEPVTEDVVEEAGEEPAVEVGEDPGSEAGEEPLAPGDDVADVAPQAPEPSDAGADAPGATSAPADTMAESGLTDPAEEAATATVESPDAPDPGDTPLETPAATAAAEDEPTADDPALETAQLTPGPDEPADEGGQPVLLPPTDADEAAKPAFQALACPGDPVAAPGCALAAEAIRTVSAPGPAGLEVRLNQPDGIYLDQEFLVVETKAPADLGGYLYLDVLTDAGSVYHLLPEPMREDNTVEPGAGFRVGVEEDQQAAGVRTWQVGEPFGEGYLLAVISEKPLYEGLRPIEETIEEYREALLPALGDGALGRTSMEVVRLEFRPR